MSRGVETDALIAINWGSTNFRAFLIGKEGAVIEEYSAPAGVLSLDRGGMASLMDDLAMRWPSECAVYASGMIGSNVGWIEVPYAQAPASLAALAKAAVTTRIGNVTVHIVPGIACRRSFDGELDILRGEEIELMGLAALQARDGWVALPGTHTKWARLEQGLVAEFFTSMSGEIFDRLTTNGLLSSIVADQASDRSEFLRGVDAGRTCRLSLSTSLFGARAQVLLGALAKADAASYIRGLLIGSEIADALVINPMLRDNVIPLVGNRPLCTLYRSALLSIGISSEIYESSDTCVRGFYALNRARNV